MRIHWPAAAMLAFLIVLGCTLFPFQVSFEALSSHRLPDLLFIGIGRDRAFDVLTNLLLFVPVGVALAGVLEQRRVGGGCVIAAVLFTSAAMSYAIEVLQQFIPGRFSSLTDVLSNTAGGAIGAIYYRLWRTSRAASHGST